MPQHDYLGLYEMILIRECQRCRKWAQNEDVEAEERVWRVCECGGRMVIEGKYQDHLHFAEAYTALNLEIPLEDTRALDTPSTT